MPEFKKAVFRFKRTLQMSLKPGETAAQAMRRGRNAFRKNWRREPTAFIFPEDHPSAVLAASLEPDLVYQHPDLRGNSFIVTNDREKWIPEPEELEETVPLQDVSDDVPKGGEVGTPPALRVQDVVTPPVQAALEKAGFGNEDVLRGRIADGWDPAEVKGVGRASADKLVEAFVSVLREREST